MTALNDDIMVQIRKQMTQVSGYKKDLAEAVRGYLEQIRAAYTFDPEQAGFVFAMPGTSSLKRYDLCVFIGTDEIITRVTADPSVPVRNRRIRNKVMNLVNMINYLNDDGCLSLNDETGEITCRTAVCCGGYIPSRDLIRYSIELGMHMFDFFAPAFAGVIEKGMSIEDAMDYAGQCREESVLRRIVYPA